MQNIQFGEHWLGAFSHYTVHLDTIIMVWTAMAAILLFAFVVTRKLCRVPDGMQAFSEMIIKFIKGINKDQMGKDGDKHLAFIASLFLFVLISNLMGQLPWRLYHLEQGEFASPTNDLNVTIALAVLVLVYYFAAGISKKGLGYFKHYLKPYWFLLPINILEDITRPLTLALRLFGNILAGEVVVLIVLAFIPLVAPVPVMLFELFVAFLQAFIFAILSASYIGSMIADEH